MHKYCKLARLTRLFLPGWSGTLTKAVATMIDAALETKPIEYSSNQGSLMPHGTMKSFTWYDEKGATMIKENVSPCTLKKWDQVASRYQQGFFLVGWGMEI